MPNYLNIKHGYWYMHHEVSCTVPALEAWLGANPKIGYIIGSSTRPGKFYFWTVLDPRISLDSALQSIAQSTHASLGVASWFVHSDAPYAGTQTAVGGDYVVADHITDQSVSYFKEIQRHCCMHCSVELGRATQEEYEASRARNEAVLAGFPLVMNPEPEPPPEYTKLGMTKADVLLCSVLDMKLKTMLDNPGADARAVRATYDEIRDLVLKIHKNAPVGMDTIQKFAVVQTLFPNSKLRLVKSTEKGDLETFDTAAPIPPEPPDDGVQSFGI